jgi:hypothetical protein
MKLLCLNGTYRITDYTESTLDMNDLKIKWLRFTTVTQCVYSAVG